MQKIINTRKKKQRNYLHKVNLFFKLFLFFFHTSLDFLLKGFLFVFIGFLDLFILCGKVVFREKANICCIKCVLLFRFLGAGKRLDNRWKWILMGLIANFIKIPDSEMSTFFARRNDNKFFSNSFLSKGKIFARV